MSDARMTAQQRLQRIKEIIEAVDNRAMACDGPVPPTLQVMTQREISEIYRLAGGPIGSRPAKPEAPLTMPTYEGWKGSDG